ncbi:MAG: hypothetical protein NC915_02805 [Candidatus Omnitrophica bacterium]|nr:hypothetical protein [Candidatus Omnitrophota bacterium]
MKYIIFALHGYLELFKRKEGKTLFEYAKKYNFENFMENGRWGYLLFDKSLEKSYFKFFCSDKDFPGVSFLRALRYKIKINKNDVFWLGEFVFSFNNKIIETEINLNPNEKKVLLEEIKKQNGFEFYIFEKDIILKFLEQLPRIENNFPNRIKNQKIDNILFKQKSFEKLNKLMKESLDILNNHPINKVRLDLNEPAANFLYFFGMGKYEEKVDLKEIIRKKIFYFSEKNILDGLVEFFRIEKTGEIFDIKDECIYWFDFFLDCKTGPSIWVKNFEIFSNDFLGKIPFRQDARFLFVFDPFIDENKEYEKTTSLFLAVNFPNRLKNKYKKSSLLFEKFIE